MGNDLGDRGWRDVGKAIAKGSMIGVANVIPGVSGGTLALMLGIYQRTINAICSVNLHLLRLVLALPCQGKRAWSNLWEYAHTHDLFFLGWLGGGAILGIVLFARVMGWLLDAQRELSSAFFLGLVLVSILFPWRCLTRRSWREGCAFLLACALAVGLSTAVSEEERVERAMRKQAVAETSAVDTFGQPQMDAARLLLIFAGAVLALSAMVLPGVSGSFLLLLLGIYTDVLTAVNERNLLVIGVFMAGAVIGLLLFTRVIGWLLGRAFNLTMAFMIGLMVGSLYELWPFKRMLLVGEEWVILGNAVTGIGLGAAVGALVAAMLGACLVIGVAWLGER